jgi:predicted enzyme related to lactoylglutathione lyase
MKTKAKVSPPRGIDAVYYMVKDVARARAFYEDALGFQASFVSETGEWLGAEYELPTGQTFGIGKSEQVPFRESGGVMISVEDVADATRRVVEGGGKVQMGPMDTPVCIMSWCEDTEGNTFSLHHRKDGSVG